MRMQAEIDAMQPVVLPDTVTAIFVRTLSWRQKIVGLKQTLGVINTAYGEASHVYETYKAAKGHLNVFYEEMLAEFKDQGRGGAARNGKPTLRQAFNLAGWNYDAARTFKYRYDALDPKKDKLKSVPEYEEIPVLQLTAGDKVLLEDVEYEVRSLDLTSQRAVLARENDDGNGGVLLTSPICDGDGIPLLEKVKKPAARKLEAGDLCLIGGVEYEFTGYSQSSFRRTLTPTPEEVKKQAEAEALKDKKAREDARAREKKIKDDRKAEALRRDREKIDKKKAVKKPANEKPATRTGEAAAAAQEKDHANGASLDAELQEDADKVETMPCRTEGLEGSDGDLERVHKVCVTCGEEFKDKPRNRGLITQCDNCGDKVEVPVLKGFTEVEGSKGTTRTVVPVMPDVFDKAMKQARTGSVRTN
jgi:DNA-directed RNA polymerase subunit RPC12/RpoP